MTSTQQAPSLAPKPVRESEVVMSELMLPTDANPAGNVHGGVIMKLVDIAASVAAQKHARSQVVTARIDSLSFLQPVFLGNLVTLRASVNAVGTTSMEVGVRVEAEDLMSGNVRHVASAYLVFVALDAEGRPRPVPPLIAETEEQRRRMAEATLRREHRLRGEEAVRVRRRRTQLPALALRPGRRALVVAHRGASALAPENTLAAFERAAQIGADFVELDVHLSKDDALIVIHDPSLERTTNGQGLVREKLAAELKKLDAGSWFSPQFAGERLLTLDEALDWARGRIRVAVEIKHGPIPYEGIEDRVVAALESHDMASDALVISFDHTSVQRVRALSHTIATGVLYVAHPVDPVSLAVAAGADVLQPNWGLLTVDEVEVAHRAGLAIIPWTVNDPNTMQQLLAMGVDGITTDYPDRLVPLVS